MFAKSIRTRFLLWLAFLLVAILSGFGFTAFRLHTANQFRSVDRELDRRLRSLNMDVRSGPRMGPGGPFRGGRRGGPPPFEENGPPDFRRGRPPEFPSEFDGPRFPEREVKLSTRTENLFDESDTNSFYFAIWSPGGALQKRSTNAPANLTRPAKSGRDTSTHFENRGEVREAYHYTEIGHAIVVARPISDFIAQTRRFAALLFAAGCGILGVGLGGAWILTTRALRPIKDISAAANRISSSKLDQRIDVADTDSELGQLATLLNSTFARLEAAFAQQKQFTGDAAHELRTPLTVIISEVQTTLARPRSAEEYRETLQTCLETAQRMRGLSQSLLELARFDSGQESIQRERFDYAEKLRASIELIQPLASERHIAVRAGLDPIEISADPMRLEQVITNLLSNAVFYNNDRGQIDVSLRAQNGMAILKVSDTGRGIEAGDLAHIFERFYRADKSRAKADGHSGLGLAISKAIVDAHGGSIEVQSAVGQGTTFTVSLPLASS